MHNYVKCLIYINVYMYCVSVCMCVCKGKVSRWPNKVCKTNSDKAKELDFCNLVIHFC